MPAMVTLMNFKARTHENCFTVDSYHSSPSLKSTTSTTRIDCQTGKDHSLPGVALETEGGRSKSNKIAGVASKFCQLTSAHGWKRVVAAKTKARSAVWIVITLLALGCSMYHISSLLSQYLQYSTEIKWQLVVSEVGFPSVTVCNILPMSPSATKSLLSDPQSKLYQWQNIVQNLDELNNWAAKMNLSRDFEHLVSRLREPLGYFENIGVEVRQVGHQKEDFVLDCTFGFEPCRLEKLTYFQTSSYFNCYTFNGKNSKTDHLVASSTGPYEGLSLVLYLENDSGDGIRNATYHSTSTIGNAMGVRVVVHSQYTRPNPVDEGHDLPPGFSVSLGLHMTRLRRLDAPYGQCVREDNPYVSGYAYSSQSCLLDCEQQYVIADCKCISAKLPVPEKGPKSATIVGYCGRWDPSLLDARDNVLALLANLRCESESLRRFAADERRRATCPCYPNCVENETLTDISYSYWPHDFVQMDFFDRYVLSNKSAESKARSNLQRFNSTQLVDGNLIRKNFVRLNVYMQSMSIEEYKEQESYTATRLYSDVGGVFGLWIGVSFITVWEVVDLLATILIKVSPCRRARSTVTQQEQSGEK